MDELPATQAQNGPAIFRNDDGRALRIFVEACGIVHRPKLVRALKKAGADICGDPKQAQIILVDARTFEGRKFIRDWGCDAGKVVLEYGWASKSLVAGKALTAADQWGNCLTKDDGLTLDPDVNFDDEVFTNKSPLPTPRVTPVDASVVQEKAPQKPPVSMSMDVDASETTNVITQDQQLPPCETLEQPASVHDGLQYPAITNELPSIPMQQITPYQRSIAQPFHPMQHPAQTTMTQSIAQQFWAQMFNTDPFAMSLVDSMRNHGIVPYSMPQPQGGPVYQQPGSSGRSPHEVTQLPVNDYPMEPIDNVGTASRPSTPSLPASTSRKPKPSTNGPPPQVGRRSVHRRRSASPTASSAPKTKRQKQREKSPEGRRKTIAYIRPPYPLHDAESPRCATREDRSQKVFVSDKGRPITFFVQVDQPNRFNVVSLIKKNGGKIGNAQTAADYAVLYSHSTTFMDLLTSTIDARKTAVSPAYIHDSVKEGALLDPAQYKFKLTGKSKKRTAILSSSSDVEELTPNETVAIEQRRGGQHKRHQDGKKCVRQEPRAQNSNIQSIVKTEPQEVEIVFERPKVPSPTPPPEHTQQRLAKGYKYSDVEREYAIKYMRILLGRDHQMSSQAMADRLYRKMQHHSFQSWRSFIGTSGMREEVEKLRKKAGIAYRKAMQHKHPEVIKEEPQNMDLNGTGTGVPGANEARNEVEEDLDVICNFFAYGGGGEQNDGGDQDAVWARLSSKATCKTANSWVEFYDQHYPLIKDRYTKLTELAAEQNTSNNDSKPVNKTL